MSPRSVAAGDVPWTRSMPARGVRSIILRGVFAPLVAGWAQVQISGAESLAQLEGPVVFVANHSSHVDTPIILNAMSPARRRHTLMAAAADYFYVRRSLGMTVSLAFGAVPVRRHPGDGSSALEPLARLVADGWSIVLYAEGTRSRDGRLGPLRSGAAALSAREGVPLLPVHVEGTSQLMPPGHGWMVRPDDARRHRVSVRFGEPRRPRPDDDLAAVMTGVRAFLEGETPGPAPLAPAPSLA